MSTPARVERKNVLDHGYVEFVERWGSDQAIVEAARMSTDKGFLGWEAESTWRCDECEHSMIVPHNDPARIVVHAPAQPIGVTRIPVEPFFPVSRTHRMTYVKGHSGDEKLLRYLYAHRHMSPFEMGGMTLEVQAPIFVFMEWHRHHTQSYNELSARYAPLPDVNYVPSVERLMANSNKLIVNEQAAAAHGNFSLSASDAEDVRQSLIGIYERAEALYQLYSNIGVPKELARLVVTVGRYSRMRVSANLRNWLQFLTLRLDEAAQWEIRQYAVAVAELVQYAFPRTSALFHDGRDA